MITMRDPPSNKTAIAGRYALYRTETFCPISYSGCIEPESGMELFFMMTAMLALLGPIAVGRVRCICIRIAMRPDRSALDAGVLPGQICSATLHVCATAALRRQQFNLRSNAAVRSSVRTASDWLARPRSFSRDLPAS